MSSTNFIEGKIILSDSIIEGSIEYNSREIIAISKTHIGKDAPYIFPGFIDIHTHGCNNFDVMQGTVKSILSIASHKAAQGVVQFLPTTLTSTKENLIQALCAIKDAYDRQRTQPDFSNQSEIIGIHFEGPYISKTKYRGAQNPDYICHPNVDEFNAYLENSGNLIKIITLAPELHGALEFIKKVKKKDIRISVGHSEADASIMQKAFAAGISSATHIFNGMKEFNHYDVGCAGSVLINDDVYCEVIGDGKHVVLDAIDIVLRCKPKDKIMFITDSTAYSGMPDGKYILGKVPIVVQNGESRTLDGGMAGSLVRMDEILRNLVRHFHTAPNANNHLSLSEIGRMLSQNQAEFLKLERCGKIEPTYKPNFTICNCNFEVEKTIRDGCVIFSSQEQAKSVT